MWPTTGYVTRHVTSINLTPHHLTVATYLIPLECIQKPSRDESIISFHKNEVLPCLAILTLHHVRE